MSNVLPREAQRAVWRMYRARFITAGSLVAIATAGLALLALLPSYLALHAAEGRSISAVPSGEKDPKVQNERILIARAQSLLTTLAPLASATTTASDTIATSLALRPKGVTVDHIIYAGGSPGEVVIVGFAHTRDRINAYRQALENDPHFKTVTVPVADLAGTQGGKFSITISGTF